MTDAIIDAMHWLGLDFDEGPLLPERARRPVQQPRGQLLESGKAYYCSCTSEEVEAMRETARATGLKPKYNGKCRELGLGPGPAGWSVQDPADGQGHL
jgi:glutamyl-tRNA synthetase (EC 6.1.1.17)